MQTAVHSPLSTCVPNVDANLLHATVLRVDRRVHVIPVILSINNSWISNSRSTTSHERDQRVLKTLRTFETIESCLLKFK